MTCIVGLECDDGTCWIAGDRYFGTDHRHDMMDVPKVVRRGRVLMGFCGGMAEGQLLERVDPPRPRDRGESIDSYVADAVVAPLMEAKRRSAIAMNNELEGIIAVAGRVYAMEADGGFWRSKYGYQGVGAASPYALGSLACTHDVGPEDRLRLALEAAKKHSPYCLEPFDFIRLPR